LKSSLEAVGFGAQCMGLGIGTDQLSTWETDRAKLFSTEMDDTQNHNLGIDAYFIR
jgi:hypothetical protein